MQIETWIRKRVKKDTPLWGALTAIYYHPKSNWRWWWDLRKIPYRKITRNSIFFEESELHMCSLFPQRTLDATVEMFNPQTVLDLGCGTGRSLDYFVELGIEAQGIEGSSVAISRARHPELIQQIDFNHEVNLNRKFDLVWCFEVVEHIHPKYVHNLMKTFSNHADCVVISAARPGQGGEGHFNEQPPEYWIKKFKDHGYECDETKTERLRSLGELFSENMLVFVRPEIFG
ncbi:MAG TPA: class I SAM-dependent methyltransferase [Pyrinomonadaceae bacterium]